MSKAARCVVPECRGALISREGEDALMHQVFPAHPLTVPRMQVEFQIPTAAWHVVLCIGRRFGVDQ